jgi:hypothetical protein
MRAVDDRQHGQALRYILRRGREDGVTPQAPRERTREQENKPAEESQDQEPQISLFSYQPQIAVVGLRDTAAYFIM